MKQKSLTIAAASSAMTFLVASNAFAASEPTGVWMDDTGRGAVEIKACGSNLCGFVVAVKSAADTKGCGKQIIGDAQSVGGGLWDNGWIYSPEKRKNYDVELKPLSDGTLRVVGYAGTKLFSRTMIWTRASADLKRCGVEDAKAPAPAVARPAVAAAAAVTSAPSPVVPPLAKDAAKNAANDAASAGKAVAAAAPPAPDATSAAQPPAAAKPATGTAKPDVAPEPMPPVEQDAKATSAQPTVTEEADASDADDESGEKPGKRTSKGGSVLKNLKLGDLDLDKVLTRTKSGKCKLDLPWVKVSFECER